MNISFEDHITNEEAHRKIKAAIVEYDELVTMVKKQKLSWFGNVSRFSGLGKTMLLGTVNEKRSRQKKKWEDFASSTRAAENSTSRKGVAAKSSVVYQPPSKVME